MRSSVIVSYATPMIFFFSSSSVSSRNRREVEVGEEELAVLEPLEVGLDRLLDLHDHVGRVVDRVGVGKDLRAGGVVLLVGEAAAVAGALLHEHFVAVGGEVARAGRASCPRDIRCL